MSPGAPASYRSMWSAGTPTRGDPLEGREPASVCGWRASGHNADRTGACDRSAADRYRRLVHLLSPCPGTTSTHYSPTEQASWLHRSGEEVSARATTDVYGKPGAGLLRLLPCCTEASARPRAALFAGLSSLCFYRPAAFVGAPPTRGTEFGGLTPMLFRRASAPRENGLAHLDL